MMSLLAKLGATIVKSEPFNPDDGRRDRAWLTMVVVGMDTQRSRVSQPTKSFKLSLVQRDPVQNKSRNPPVFSP